MWIPVWTLQRWKPRKYIGVTCVCIYTYCLITHIFWIYTYMYVYLYMMLRQMFIIYIYINILLLILKLPLSVCLPACVCVCTTHRCSVHMEQNPWTSHIGALPQDNYWHATDPKRAVVTDSVKSPPSANKQLTIYIYISNSLNNQLIYMYIYMYI